MPQTPPDSVEPLLPASAAPVATAADPPADGPLTSAPARGADEVGQAVDATSFVSTPEAQYPADEATAQPAQAATEPPAPVEPSTPLETSRDASIPAAPTDVPDTAAPREAAVAELSPAACAALLAQHYPGLFAAGRPLPIKLRIQADIQQRTPGLFSKKSLSIFLHRHTTSTAYIRALVNSPHRFDLDGQPAGEIAQEHRDAGVAELERRLAIVQARRAAERDAQRQAYRDAAAAARAAQAPGARQAAAADGLPAPAQGQEPTPAASAERPARPARADRPPRPPHPDRPPRPPRPPRPDQPPRADRPPRPDHAQADRPSRDRDARPESRPDVRPTRPVPEAVAAAPSAALTPEQVAESEARRGRAALLRAYETTTLTRANFCALKGMSDAALEALLVQAQADRKLHPLPVIDREGPPQDRPRFDERGPRRDAPPQGAGRPGRPGRPSR